MRRSLLNMKRRVALSMAVVMAATLLPAASPKPYRAKAAETELSNPVIVEDDFTGERTVAWDSVYFGSYPQAEVITGGRGIYRSGQQPAAGGGRYRLRQRVLRAAKCVRMGRKQRHHPGRGKVSEDEGGRRDLCRVI